MTESLPREKRSLSIPESHRDSVTRDIEKLQSIPLLWDARELARLFAVSVPTIWRMRAAGKLPPCIRLSASCVRWRVDDVREWVALGCPDHAAFIALSRGQTVEVRHA